MVIFKPVQHLRKVKQQKQSCICSEITEFFDQLTDGVAFWYQNIVEKLKIYNLKQKERFNNALALNGKTKVK